MHIVPANSIDDDVHDCGVQERSLRTDSEGEGKRDFWTNLVLESNGSSRHDCGTACNVSAVETNF